MVTAKALIRAGLVKLTGTKPLRGQDVPDQLELACKSTAERQEKSH